MKIIIAGAGNVGTHLAKLLSREKQDIILMDDDEEKLSALSANFDLLTVAASPSSISGLKEVGVKEADLFIAVTPDESRNMTACMLATNLGAKKTVARIDNYEYLLPKNKEFFQKLGVDSLIYPEMLAAKEIVSSMRMSWVRQWWEFDVLVGINLLREGLDVPEVSLVAILDADKEGFLRSERSLVQTIGRAARNASGKVIMYADNRTESMQKAIDETMRRRSIQEAYNKEHHIVPKTIKKEIRELISITKTAKVAEEPFDFKHYQEYSKEEKELMLAKLEKEMKDAAKALDFERAATLRDTILELKSE